MNASVKFMLEYLMSMCPQQKLQTQREIFHVFQDVLQIPKRSTDSVRWERHNVERENSWRNFMTFTCCIYYIWLKKNAKQQAKFRICKFGIRECERQEETQQFNSPSSCTCFIAFESESHISCASSGLMHHSFWCMSVFMSSSWPSDTPNALVHRTT